MTRLLLPFTFGIEMDVLESLVLLASNQRATLIPLSLISLPSTKRKRVRLELMQQSKDFLEAVRHKAARHQVPLEPVELFTRDLRQSILTLVGQVHCDGILLATRGTRGSLLRMETIEHLIDLKPCSLYVVSFPPKKSDLWMARVRERFTKVWLWSRDAGEPQHRDLMTLVPFPRDELEKQQEPEEQKEREEQEPVVLSLASSSLLDSQPRA